MIDIERARLTAAEYLVQLAEAERVRALQFNAADLQAEVANIVYSRLLVAAQNLRSLVNG